MSHRRFTRLVAVAFSGTLVFSGALVFSGVPLAPAATAAPAFGSVVVRAEDAPTGDGIEYRDEDGNLVDPVEVEHTGYDRSTLARDEVLEENPADPVEESPLVLADEHAGRVWPWIFPALAVAGLGYYLYHLWQRRKGASLNGPLGQS